MSTSTDIFNAASRLKLRFESPKGLLTTEDLWDLPLTSATGKANLDDMARTINRKLKSSDEISFVTPVVSRGNTDQLMFDIVKHIIDVRIAERDAAAEASTRREKKQQILALIANKENEQLAGTSLDELRKMAEGL